MENVRVKGIARCRQAIWPRLIECSATISIVYAAVVADAAASFACACADERRRFYSTVLVV